MRIIAQRIGLASLALAVAGTTVALGQATTPAPGTPATPGTPPATPGVPQLRSTGVPQRDTLIRMMRPITIEFRDQRLEDIMRFIGDVTQADIDVMWADDRNVSGLDKEQLITLRSAGASALTLLEKVLEKAVTDPTVFGTNTWQLTETGTMQVGPKERLNKFRRVELYDINDMLIEIPNYANAPEFDLNSVLQSSGQGGSSQSPFQQNQQQQQSDRRPRNEKAQDLVNIITELVEKDQWEANGGDGGTIRFYQGSLIVNAPDYMHRQINGYPYWPSQYTSVTYSQGRRYVGLNVDTAHAGIRRIENQPVTAIVPGTANPPPPPPPR